MTAHNSHHLMIQGTSMIQSSSTNTCIFTAFGLCQIPDALSLMLSLESNQVSFCRESFSSHAPYPLHQYSTTLISICLIGQLQDDACSDPMHPVFAHLLSNQVTPTSPPPLHWLQIPVAVEKIAPDCEPILAPGTEVITSACSIALDVPSTPLYSLPPAFASPERAS